MGKDLVCAIYNHPEAYPPTLNAITELSKVYDNVYLLYQPNLADEWQYPGNVKLISNGDQVLTVQQQAALPITGKVKLFLSFCRKLNKLLKTYKPHTVLLYDGVAFGAYHLASKFYSGKHISWYHNHDVIEQSQANFNLDTIALYAQRKGMKNLDVFSLPSDERLSHFDLSGFNGKYFLIPNYPAVSFYKKFKKKARHPDDTLKLLFQGSITDKHGFEKICDFIAHHKANISLSLIGSIADEYRQQLLAYAASLNIADKVKVLARVNYAHLPAITMQHDVGLAILPLNNVMYATGKTASNKIYEYAAIGLPILYYANESYISLLSKYDWAFATDLSDDKLVSQFETIKSQYDRLSAKAISDHETFLNYEKVIAPAIQYTSSLNVQ